MTMTTSRTRILLTALLLAIFATATACGEDEADGPSSPTIVDVDVVAQKIVSAPGAGTVGDQALDVTDPADLRGWSKALPAPVRQQVRQAAQAMQVPEGRHLYAQVVRVGCETAPSIEIDGGTGKNSAVRFVAPTEAPNIDCITALTSVALVVL
ncbi:hypothetical protein [Nocardioides acrostichi]|uniref:Lipoprotein n=1 Tax=Nocardioides acrostichi TaxID=2784339 RepID=A0A930Y762_9ACTN|nr:hypothetical protein [Nocardioides acrostichi]MBF4161707.1 hypothetical protein [Nocardioides acrostichi]